MSVTRPAASKLPAPTAAFSDFLPVPAAKEDDPIIINDEDDEEDEEDDEAAAASASSYPSDSINVLVSRRVLIKDTVSSGRASGREGVA